MKDGDNNQQIKTETIQYANRKPISVSVLPNGGFTVWIKKVLKTRKEFNTFKGFQQSKTIWQVKHTSEKFDKVGSYKILFVFSLLATNKFVEMPLIL